MLVCIRMQISPSRWEARRLRVDLRAEALLIARLVEESAAQEMALATVGDVDV